MNQAFALVLMTIGLLVLGPKSGSAQNETLQFLTVERPPFAFEGADGADGFSIALMEAIAAELGRTVDYTFAPSFGEMLAGVEAGVVDGAVANISITSTREQVIDFSQPIFASGIGILLTETSGGNSILGAIFTWDFAIAVLAALGLLFGGGMLMWMFERRAQPYFDRGAKDAMFPAFWWALNLVVNGGFEERMPQSRMGRGFAVILVISSLFIVSIFVANITAAMTVGALQDSVDSVNDLEGREIATIGGSTSAQFLEARDIRFEAFEAPTQMFEAFEDGDVEAIVFDAPILAYYMTQTSRDDVRHMNRTYRPENYGIALPQNSQLREQIDLTLLRLREDGTYDALMNDWFGGVN